RDGPARQPPGQARQRGGPFMAQRRKAQWPIGIGTAAEAGPRPNQGQRDVELVAAFYGGDDGAFDELYARYFPRLGLCLRRFVGEADAEDLAEETFVRVALARQPNEGQKGRFAPGRPATFRPWLFRSAHDLCIRRRPESAPHAGVAEEEGAPPEEW